MCLAYVDIFATIALKQRLLDCTLVRLYFMTIVVFLTLICP